MRIAYLDTIAGISGDMTIGAFISAGIPLEDLSRGIQQLNIPGVELEASRVERHGISSVRFDVVVSPKAEHHRHLSDIIRIIRESSLNERIQNNAVKIFMEVANAEARVHNVPVEKIHFHEVGAIDSIVDIVGTAICLDMLRIDKIYSSPVKLGCSGVVKADHGVLPIPTPATVEILKGYEVVLTEIPFELTTPTGAAIVKALSSGILSSEKIIAERIGYGSGSRELSGIPNILRIIIGEMPSATEEDEAFLVESNIDDMNPEICSFVIERLFAVGALDAYITPVIMKKGRPGFLVSALVNRSVLDHVLELFWRETTTIGLRIQPVGRKKLTREQREVRSAKFGVISMKVILVDNSERFMPEFEECKKLALTHSLALRDVYRLLDLEFNSKK